MKLFSRCLLLLFLTLSFNHSWTYAAENDQFAAWDKDIQDSTDILNEYVNREVRRIVQRVNRRPWSHSCYALIFKVGMHFSQGGVKKTDLWAENNDLIDKYPPERSSIGREGIYRDVKKLRNVGRTIKINNVHIGVDKLSHSLAFGFVYYLQYHRHLRKLRKVYPHDPAKAERRAIEGPLILAFFPKKLI